MDKKPLIVVSICVVILLLIASMNCTVSADQIRNHSVTIEITGQNTQQQRTINVSDTELQDIKDVFAEVSVLLASASSPEDKLQVYWNAICRLHDSGVLGDLSCEDAYRIVTRWYRPSISLPNHHPLKDSNNTNAFCLVSGRVNYSISSNRVSNFVNRFCDYLAYLQPFGHTLLLFLLSWAVLFISNIAVVFLGAFLQHIVERNPIAIGNLIGIGAYLNHSKAGWIKTDGFLGTKNWDGNLTGALPGYIHLWPIYYYQAMRGFCGIKLRFDNSWVGYDASYLGSALVVGINEMA